MELLEKALTNKKELDRLMGEHEVVIYLFFGNTTGNLNQNDRVRMLHNLLCPGNYVLLDVAGFTTITPCHSGEIAGTLYKRSPHPCRTTVFATPP